ncbi:MAG: glycoside hydrolase family 28 protein [Candidatus Omnitrophica bacterium]|nr:glycoside hydrolase family 28 protein [Candidatus Omnitrophota bacterium]
MRYAARFSKVAVWALLAIVLNAGAVCGAFAVESKPFYSAADFGAKGDGKTMDTKAIQAAVDAASQAGGGTVALPAGTYLSGTIFLKSRIHLYLAPGATLLGSRNQDDYPETIPQIRSYTDNYVKQSLIFGENLVDVSITGQGVIDGQGEAFRWKEYIGRPYIIRLISCEKILIEGIMLTNSAMWMQHYLACEDVTIRGVRVFNHVTYNNDGLDIDSCRNVRISDCAFDSDDDALCLKSTTGKPCEDVVITNCVLSSHCNAFKMGTESNGGFKNITLSNCAIHSPRDSESQYGMKRGISGISLEIVDGGIMDGVSISNISMQGVSVPIFIRLGNRARPFEKDGPIPGVGVLQNVHISHVIATGVSNIGCSITGQPERFVKNVCLQDIQIEYEGGGTMEEAQKSVLLKPNSYPEATMFGVLPAYGFYCRYVEGLSLRQIQVGWKEEDVRSALLCEKMKDLVIEGLQGAGVLKGYATVDLNHVQDVMIYGCRVPAPADLFLRMRGETENVSLTANDLRQAQTRYEFESDKIKESFFESANRYAN